MSLLAFQVGAFCVFLSAAFFFYMLWLRFSVRRERERNAHVVAEWEPLFHRYLEKSDATVFAEQKPLQSSEVPAFLHLWNYLHESLRGRLAEKLNYSAETFNLPEETLKLLKNGNLSERLLAITTLGNLGAPDSWQILEKLTSHRDPIVSFWAVRALFKLDPVKATGQFLPLIAKREDWAVNFVAGLLEEVDVEIISEPLGRLVMESFRNKLPEKQLARLISYLKLAIPENSVGVIHQIITETDQPEVIIACLRLFPPLTDIQILRKLIQHEHWTVRMYAANAFGRVGGRDDAVYLTRALSDLEWWVRYRAACAIYAMPHFSSAEIDKLAENHINPFAKDILLHVGAEIKLKCLPLPSSPI